MNGLVIVRPDAEKLAHYEQLRRGGPPKITVEHLPRLAREAFQSMHAIPEMSSPAKVPELPAWQGEALDAAIEGVTTSSRPASLKRTLSAPSLWSE